MEITRKGEDNLWEAESHQAKKYDHLLLLLAVLFLLLLLLVVVVMVLSRLG